MSQSWANLPTFLARGLMAAPATVPAAVGPFSALTTLITQNIACTEGRRYEVTARFFDQTGTVLADRFTFQTKADGNTLLEGQQSVFIDSTTIASDGAVVIGTYLAAASSTVAFTLTGIRGAGTGTTTVNASAGTPITLYVKDVGGI